MKIVAKQNVGEQFNNEGDKIITSKCKIFDQSSTLEDIIKWRTELAHPIDLYGNLELIISEE